MKRKMLMVLSVLTILVLSGNSMMAQSQSTQKTQVAIQSSQSLDENVASKADYKALEILEILKNADKRLNVERQDQFKAKLQKLVTAGKLSQAVEVEVSKALK